MMVGFLVPAAMVLCLQQESFRFPFEKNASNSVVWVVESLLRDYCQVGMQRIFVG